MSAIGERKRSSSRIIIICIVAAVIVATIIGIFVYKNSPRQQYLKQMRLGDKYVQQLEYEQAVAMYTKAMDIIPNDMEAYEKLVDTYLNWADKLISDNDYAQAKSVVERGLLQLNDERLKEKLEQIERAMIVGRLKLIMTVDAGEYIGHANGGVIPIKSNELYGATDYEGNTIIPCEYDGFRAPNDKGYIVMIKNIVDSYYYEYTVFDNKGNAVFNCNNNVLTTVASGDLIIVSRCEGEFPEEQVIIDFYDYSGALLTSVNSHAASHEYPYIEGVVDGKAIVQRQFEDRPRYISNIGNNANSYLPYEYGFVSSDGSIEWIDGDGIDENDPNQSSLQKEVNPTTGEIEIVNTNAATNFFPIGPVNQGLFLSYDYTNLSASRLRLIDVYGKIHSELELTGIPLSRSNKISFHTEKENFGAYQFKLYLADNMDLDSYVDLVTFYVDGGEICNYGSKILLYSENKYALVDMDSDSDDLNIKTYDFLAISNEKYWLVSSDDKWGFVDHDGNIVELYDDASEFYKGFAMIKEAGKAYLIDDNLNKLGEISEADGISRNGELFIVEKDGISYIYIID